MEKPCNLGDKDSLVHTSLALVRILCSLFLKIPQCSMTNTLNFVTADVILNSREMIWPEVVKEG